MPPIEVFVGLDAIRSSAEEIPGLPTRTELQVLLDEHDRIEKETEIFDTGELKRLRKLTKGSSRLSTMILFEFKHIQWQRPLNGTYLSRTPT